jgi:hypothetical protein
MTVRAAIAAAIVCTSIGSGATPAACEERRSETEHLQFVWSDDAVSDEGIARLQGKGERYYTAIFEMLGHAPAGKIEISLGGAAQGPDGWNVPHVDGSGRVHLFRFGASEDDYVDSFAHELVHAMRIDRMPHYDWFFEEGLAEFIALRMEERLEGFPWYGFPVTAVAGRLLTEGEDIPLTVLRERHHEINLLCRAQAYPLRASFFDYLGKEYGEDAVLALAKEDEAGAVGDYEKHLGLPWEALVEDWRAGLRAAYDAIEDAAEQAERYRSETAIRYTPLCNADGSTKEPAG